MNTIERANHACGILDEKKGESIRMLDVSELSSLSDVFVIVTGTSPPHLRALFDAVQRGFKDRGEQVYRRCGEAGSGWLVLDYVDFVIHIFDPEKRTYYGIEDLWKEAPEIERLHP